MNNTKAKATHTHKVCACLDRHPETASVIDWAAWAAGRLDAPLELLHVLERPADRAGADYTGALGLGAQETLLLQLAELDEARGRLAQEAGRHLLAAGQAHVHALTAGLSHCSTRLRHGELVDAALEGEHDTRLFVLGQHHRDQHPVRRHLDHHLERLIRAVQRPVLVSTGSFAAPTRFAIAYDGSPTAQRAMERVAQSPLLTGLPAELVMAGRDTASHHQTLAQARQHLEAAGFLVTTTLLEGEPEQQLPAHLKANGTSLLVIGAYGHTRIREWIVGSTTTALLRASPCPLLILR
ncbi:universal stress protein [Sphaerotilus sp.]|uniref:universal stress protein n=1 Tax=Sphaerotilus sp. TaxID=2093942 RepID=UPI002ACEA137|nr:universal stress protein [Sphaerotilus sp.]MDZ7858772.1 universal stress protein [Sphaerotilus sp.]